MKCGICRGEMTAPEATIVCPECRIEYHRECWQANAGCGTPGCSQLPSREKRDLTEEEQGRYWGASTKTCPFCGETIAMAAVLCRYCHERFDTKAPQTLDEVKDSRAALREEDVPEKKGAIWIFALGLLGFLAPIILLVGGLWYKNHSQVLKDKAPVHRLLTLVGLGLSMLYLLLMVVGIILASV